MIVKKFKTALVNVNTQSQDKNFNNPTEHLGIAYIASYARLQGIGVQIIDGYALNLSNSDIFAELKANMPDLVGITCEYNTFTEAMRLADLIKNTFSQATIVLGGEHATYASDEILKDNHHLIDIIVRGEGEITFAELCLKINAGEPIFGVQGIAFWDHQKMEVYKSEDRPAIENLDALPLPARDTLERCIQAHLTPAISVLGSRGCPNNCVFCNAHKFFNLGGGAKWRARSPENIVAELIQLLKRYRKMPVYPVVYFADENFVGYPKIGLDRVKLFAQLLIEHNLNFSYEIFCRTDSFDGKEDLVKLLKKSGLISVLMGIEAGSDEQLKNLKKGTKVDNIHNSLYLFKKNNIVTSSSGFLMFNPHSTLDDLTKNANFLLDVGQATLYNMSCRIHAYPGIALTAELDKKNMLTESYVHYKVDEIRFINADVQQLSDLLNKCIDIELMRREDSTMRDIDLNIARISDYFNKIDSDPQKVELLVLGHVYQQKAKVQGITYSFFMNLVNLAAIKKLSSTIFTNRFEDYRCRVTEALTELDNVYENFLTKVKKTI